MPWTHATLPHARRVHSEGVEERRSASSMRRTGLLTPAVPEEGRSRGQDQVLEANASTAL